MIRILGALTLVTVACWSAAYGQTQREGSSVNAQLMQQMQQLASERTQLQAENAKLKGELEELKKQNRMFGADKESLERKAEGASAALARSATNVESLNQSVAQQRTRMDELVGKFRETAATLREVESERATVKSQLEARDRELKVCIDRNLALYRINDEVLDRFEDQGFWSSLAKSEPFTQLKRVEIENLVEDYRNQADDQRADVPPPGGPGE